MPFVASVAALAAIAWGTVYARRGSLVLGCGLLLWIGYVLGYPFWHAKFGPLPITLDRLVLLGLTGAAVVQWRLGRLQPVQLAAADWILAALLALLTGSLLVSGKPEVPSDAGPPLWRLVMSFGVPAAIYAIARQSRLTRRDWNMLLSGIAVAGVYLALTAVAETTQQWALVFPRYIADPTLGIHFGRARGPDLNSVSLGLFLTAAVWSAWTLARQAPRPWRLALLATLPLLAIGVVLTYTRSTWLGLLASALVVCWFQVPRRLRLPALIVAGLAGIGMLAAAWTSLLDLKREGTVGESQHSVDQRLAFTYVSWQMFQDHPLFGVGFGRFYDRKLPYLADRSQRFELESIRPLHHHNTLLGLLTETGAMGLALFVGLLAAWARKAWSLAARVGLPARVHYHGVLTLALTTSYIVSAAFHDLTFLPTQQWLLFLFAGLTVGLSQQQATVVPGSEY